MCGKRNIRFEASCFSVIELAEGVYAAIEKDGQTGSNAGIIDIGECSIMFDTFLNIDAAREFIAISRKLGCSEIKYVVNSHHHTDHIVGNSLFKNGTTIIGSTAARAEIFKMRKEFEGEKEQYQAEIDKINSTLLHEKDPVKIADMRNSLSFLTNLVKPEVGIYPPNLEFDKEIIIHGSKRSVRLISFGKAHTEGDVVAYLPGEGLCFSGDLVLEGTHPWLGNGDPESFIKALEKLSDMDIECCVTGHGHLAGKAEIMLMARYIRELLELVSERGEKELVPEDLSIDFRGWDSLCFSWNINFLKERMKKHS